MSALPAPREDGALEVRAGHAARAAAARTVLAGILLAGHLPFWLQGAFDSLFLLLVGGGLARGPALALGNGVLLLGAILLTWLIAKAVAPEVREAAARSPEEGRAAAAGACITAALGCGAAIGAAHVLDLFLLGYTGLWLLVVRLGAAALGVGLFGAHLFREVGDHARLGPTPRLYSFLSGVGMATVVSLFALGLLGISPTGVGAMAFMAGTGLGAGWAALSGRDEPAPALPERAPSELPE